MTYEELFAAAVAEARRKSVRIWDDTPPVNRSCVVDGVRLHFLDWGGHGLPPMLLIHGAMVTAHVWDFFSMEMRQHFRIYAVNLRGHGDSAWAPDGDYSRARMAADVVELLQHLDLDQVVLIGHSLGGSVGALAAAEEPAKMRALGLVDSTLLPGPRPNLMAGLVNGPDVFATIEEFAEHAARFNPRRRADRLALSLQWNARQREDGNWTWKYDPALRQRRAPDFEQVWTALGRITCPTLFIRAAEHSHATDAAVDRLRTLRHVRLAEVPEAGHNVMGDNPLVFSQAVRNFLELGAG